MITYTTGNLLAANTESIVNAVNTVGVMGKGLALQFKERFPENYRLYRKAAEEGRLKTGRMFITPINGSNNLRWIINFPTKQHWRQPSKLEYIENGLSDLAEVMKTHKIKSIALPALGCGLGGLSWTVVKPLIEKHLGDLEDVQIMVYEPQS